MKKIIIYLLVITTVFIGCTSKGDKTKEATETTTIDTVAKKVETPPVTEQLFACSMHPEVIGKKDEKCSKCGMNLTVPVKK